MIRNTLTRVLTEPAIAGKERNLALVVRMRHAANTCGSVKSTKMKMKILWNEGRISEEPQVAAWFIYHADTATC